MVRGRQWWQCGWERAIDKAFDLKDWRLESHKRDRGQSSESRIDATASQTVRRLPRTGRCGVKPDTAQPAVGVGDSDRAIDGEVVTSPAADNDDIPDQSA